jgi:hypothetical protein
MPRGWRRAASFGRHRPTAWLGFQPRNWLICSTESTGGTRVIPSGRSVPDRLRRSIFYESTARIRDSVRVVTTSPDLLSDDVETLRAALAAAHAARLEAEARATGAEAIVAHLKLLIEKLKRDRFGQSAERARQLDQLELQLEELEATATEDALAAVAAAAKAAQARPRSRASSGASRCVLPFRRIYRASGWCSRRRAPARNAAASSPSSARTSPRRSR